jgi:hypothetical protein
MEKETIVHRSGKKNTLGANRHFPIIAGLFLCISAHAQATLLVCIPGKQNAQQIQSGFDGLVGGGKTMAFGRIKDLDASLATAPDAAIIATEPFFTYTPGYKITLNGKAGGSNGEKFHIIAAAKDVTAQNIGEKKVGIVDFLGKDRLPLFIKDQFGIEIKLLKRANKEEDLLTMIGMEAVDAIIVSDSQFKEIKSNTKLPLAIVTSSSKAVGFASFGQKEGKEDDNQKKAVMKAAAPLLKEIGIDGWEPR